MSYGVSYDFSNNVLVPAGLIPPFLLSLREHVARWVTVPASRFSDQNLSLDVEPRSDRCAERPAWVVSTACR
jgi:hypothetical protein